MKNVLKCGICVLLTVSMLFCLSGCSGNNELTEENVRATVETVDTALKEFDTDTLDKYVDSKTLGYILGYAKKHEQFAELGRAIFAKMTIEVDSIDLENKTVTVKVSNKDLNSAAAKFTEELLSNYSTLQLLGQLDNEDFLNSSLGQLKEYIEKSVFDTSATVTLHVKQGDKNLILSFDDEAEDAVSGGALNAIKNIIS